MLRSLLVPLDGSEFSERSLPLAHRIAGATGASMHLAHVHVPYEPDQLLSNTQFHFEGLDMSEYDERHRQLEIEYLNGVLSRYGGNGSQVDARVLEGRLVADELAGYAEAVDADMIFMTTHGRTGMSRLWLGSVADALVRHTSVPMIVMHPERPGGVPAEVETFGHILVPLDGSQLAETILEPAMEVARATGARFTLAHVISTRAVLGPRIFPLLPDSLEPALESAEEYLEGVADGMRANGFEVDIHTTHAEAPAPAIAGLAEKTDADLIAMATHGYGGLKRKLLGSVADKVLRASPLPLLVLRPGDVD